MRFLKICWTLSKYTIFYKFTSYRKLNFGMRLKLACEELGITFVKLGQILSMRYDLLPPEDCASLQELLDKTNPISFGDIAKILNQEYKTPYQNIFKHFCEQPLGSASVSQVHKAELYDGTIVAVKIKRPNVDNKFYADIRILEKVAWTSQLLSPALRNYQILKLVGFFENWIKQDLDFIQEVQNIKKVREQYAFAVSGFRNDLGKATFPTTHDRFCTQNVIVMDFIDGIPMSKKSELLANPDYDPEKSIKSYVNAALRNWFRDDCEVFYFQADPHLSNILALPNGNAASVDFGLIAHLTKKEAQMCKDLIIAVYLQNTKKVIEIAAKMTGISYERALVIKPDIERYLLQTREEGLGYWFLEFVKIMVKHGIKFPLYLTTFGRTNLILDGLVNAYMPEKTTLDILGQELQTQALKQIWSNIINADWLQIPYAISQKINQSPRIINEFLENPLGIISKISEALK